MNYENPYDMPSSPIQPAQVPVEIKVKPPAEPADPVLRAVAAFAFVFFAIFAVAAFFHLDSIGMLITFYIFAFIAIELASIVFTGLLYPKSFN